MSRNGLYGLVGLLLIAVVALGGYLVYQQQQQPQMSITVDKSGIKVNGNG